MISTVIVPALFRIWTTASTAVYERYGAASPNPEGDSQRHPSGYPHAFTRQICDAGFTTRLISEPCNALGGSVRKGHKRERRAAWTDKRPWHTYTVDDITTA